MTRRFSPLLTTGIATDKGALALALDEGLIHTFDTAAGVQTWTAVGARAVFVVGLGLYTRDSADTTSAHDGVAVLVSLDAIRFKRNLLPETTTVLRSDLTAPPADPTIGDAYLIIGAPTGDWAGEQQSVAIFTAIDWQFIQPRVGAIVYDESRDGWFRYKPTAAWEFGLGGGTFADGSIGFRSLEFPAGLAAIDILNGPPGSPVNGDIYIVGPTPTGDFETHAGELAVREADAWTFVTAANGWRAWRTATNTLVFFNGSTWANALSASHVKRATGVATGGAGITPMTGGTEVTTQSFAMAAATNVIQVNALFQGDVGGSIFAGAFGVFFDDETSARLTSRVSVPASANYAVPIIGQISPNDTASHIYRFRSNDPTILRLEYELLEVRP